MEKKLEQLNAEYARLQTQLEQVQHLQQRMENRKKHLERGERKKRTHRLIIRGAAIESIVPDLKYTTESEFYSMMEYILAMPEVNNLVMRAAARATRIAASLSSDAAAESSSDNQKASGD